MNLNYLNNYLIPAIQTKKHFVKIPYSNNIYVMLVILFKEHFIKNICVIKNKNYFQKYILIELLYLKNVPKFNKIYYYNNKFKQYYRTYNTIKTLKFNTGLFIINTVKGIFTLSEVLKLQLGGCLNSYII